MAVKLYTRNRRIIQHTHKASDHPPDLAVTARHRGRERGDARLPLDEPTSDPWYWNDITHAEAYTVESDPGYIYLPMAFRGREGLVEVKELQWVCCRCTKTNHDGGTTGHERCRGTKLHCHGKIICDHEICEHCDYVEALVWREVVMSSSGGGEERAIAKKERVKSGKSGKNAMRRGRR